MFMFFVLAPLLQEQVLTLASHILRRYDEYGEKADMHSDSADPIDIDGSKRLAP